jgi:hypothetical protein
MRSRGVKCVELVHCVRHNFFDRSILGYHFRYLIRYSKFAKVHGKAVLLNFKERRRKINLN